jgi:lysophospholipase L1-like esterase
MPAEPRNTNGRRARRTDEAPRLSLRRKAGFSLAVLLILLVIVELVLRAAGVTFYPDAITLTQNADREIAEVPLRPDGQVQWVLEPNSLAGTPLAVNAHGMRGPEIPIEKPPGTLRILCLGDSCTFGARSEKPYPTLLQALCERRFDARVEVLNGAVPGHAAHQGTAMLERYLAFAPDIVTIYFGWNDHWCRTSALTGPELPRPPVTDHVLLLRGLRLAWEHSRARAAVSREEGIVDIARSPLRLPPMHYRAMLDEFAVLGERHGFHMVYLTAPSAFTPENLRSIIEKGWASRPEEVIELHDRYNAITREMAAEYQAPLVDLVSIFNEHVGETLLHWDGIHLSQRGHELVAQSLLEAIDPVLEGSSSPSG